MKKIISSVIAFMLLVYAMPIVTVGIRGERSEAAEEEKGSYDAGTEEGSFDRRTKISVLIGNEIKEMSMHDYLSGVLAAEMPASFPMEALKAQAVAARSYALYKMMNGDDGKHEGAQLCDDYTHCSAFFDIKASGVELWGENSGVYAERIEAAVSSTDGIVAVRNGEVIIAVFHSASSERTESALDVWGTDYPYLRSVESIGGTDAPDYYGTVTVKSSDFARTVKELYPEADLGTSPEEWFGPVERSSAGGVISIVCGGVSIKGTEIRKMLGLNSTNFRIEISGEYLVFTTKGTGHGVGMSQYGARAMALEGAFFDEIIKHYYRGVELMVKN